VVEEDSVEEHPVVVVVHLLENILHTHQKDGAGEGVLHIGGDRMVDNHKELAGCLGTRGRAGTQRNDSI
jgi:hypothetical protein